MRLLLSLMVVGVLVTEIVCPPVNPQPVEGNSEDEDALDDDSDSWEDDGEEWWDDFAEDAEEGFGLEYDRYLKEVVMALEEDSAFREKLEQMNMSDIKSGKIAMHLDLVSHHIRERLDEIKRQEIQRLRELARQKIKAMNGTQVMQSIQLYGGVQKMDQHYPHHVDVKNPHSFEMKDLENLIKKATSDLDEIDKKRKGEFKDYEMRKEHERQDELKDMDGEHRKAEEERYEEMQKKHQDHPKVHHPGSKDQLEDVWEKTDHMDPDDFDPKTFFKMHDMDGNGLLDQEEVEALFQKELDRVYDPNMPEDDMRERYEEMSRMREHVFNELDMDKDKMISVEEFMKYTTSQEFEKDEGWKGVDEQDVYSDDEFQKYEQMLREREEALQRQGLDPSMMQPGVVPLPHDPNDPNVQQMQMPQEDGTTFPCYGAGIYMPTWKTQRKRQGMPQHQQNLNQQQQQQLHQQQQQLHLQQQQQAMHQQIQQEIQQGLPPGGIPQGMPPGGVPQGMPPGGPSQGVKLPPQVPSGQPVNVQMPQGQGQMPQGQVPVNAQHPQGGAGQNAQFQPVGVVPVQQGQGQQGEPLKYEGQHQQQEERQPMV